MVITAGIGYGFGEPLRAPALEGEPPEGKYSRRPKDNGSPSTTSTPQPFISTTRNNTKGPTRCSILALTCATLRDPSGCCFPTPKLLATADCTKTLLEGCMLNDSTAEEWEHTMWSTTRVHSKGIQAFDSHQVGPQIGNQNKLSIQPMPAGQ